MSNNNTTSGLFHFCKKSEIWKCVAASAVAGALGALAVAHLYKPSFCEPKPEPKVSQEPCETKETKEKKFHLKYWNGRGLMEVPRTMLALKGVNHIDGRYTTDPPYDNVKDFAEVENTLDCNLGRMPVLTVNDSIHIGQSAAIHYYIAAELGMMGSTNEEAAQILSIREHLKDLADAKGWGYFDTPTEEQLAAFFEGGPTKASGRADGKQRSARALRWYLARLENIVGCEGFAVGSEFSLADALIYNLLGETLRDDEVSGPTVPKHKREPCGDAERMAQALAAHPNISRIVENYRGNISGYLSKRGVQKF